uniref:ChiA1-BD-binding domain protein n=1 Tax=Siphoviridae sp. ctnsL8 TaxID=2825666 RepID=A0A8S5PNA3_9CAUD|nr:MAG TPA: ChiA1-BD-binding domain protein [Siphoviridae sp. ctnsL8]
MIIDGKKFTEIQDSNKSVATFERKVFENLKPLMDAFDSGVIHEIAFDGEDVTRKMYSEPMTFSKNKDGYMISFILTDVPQKDIEAKNFNEVKPLVNDCLQTASIEVVKKYISFLNAWTVGTRYKKGQRVSYKNVPYSVISDVTAEETQTPDVSEKLYENLLKKKQEIKPWNEKTTYSKGALVIARGIVFISNIDNNKGNEPAFGNAWDYYKEK